MVRFILKLTNFTIHEVYSLIFDGIRFVLEFVRGNDIIVIKYFTYYELKFFLFKNIYFKITL